MPVRLHRPHLFLILVGLVSAAYCAIGLQLGLSRYDEALPVYGATRVLAGDIPQRDFWSMYPAGQFYTLAGVFALAGKSIMAERIWYVIVASTLCVLLYVLAAQMAGRRRALPAWIFGLIWVGSYELRVNPALAGMIGVTASLLALIAYHRSGKRSLLFAAGWCAGTAALYRQDMGGAMVAVEMVAILLLSWLPASAQRPRDKRGLLVYAAGATLAAGPAFVAALAAVPRSELWQQLVVFPIRVFPAVRGLPYPAPLPDLALLAHGPVAFSKGILAWAPYYFPMFVLFAMLVMEIVDARSGRRDPERAWEVGALWLASVVLLVKGMVRTDLSNLMPVYVILSALAAWLLKRAANHHTLLARLFAVVLVAWALTTVVVPVKRKLSLLGETIRPREYTLAMDGRAAGIRVRAADLPFKQAVDYVRENVPAGERIFVGMLRHDRLYTNDVMIYFLSERDAATRYHELHPGLTTTEPNQREIIADLEQAHARWLVLEEEHVNEPNQSSVSSGVHVLDDFIRQHFSPRACFGEYTVWGR